MSETRPEPRTREEWMSQVEQARERRWARVGQEERAGQARRVEHASHSAHLFADLNKIGISAVRTRMCSTALALCGPLLYLLWPAAIHPAVATAVTFVALVARDTANDSVTRAGQAKLNILRDACGSSENYAEIDRILKSL